MLGNVLLNFLPHVELREAQNIQLIIINWSFFIEYFLSYPVEFSSFELSPENDERVQHPECCEFFGSVSFRGKSAACPGMRFV